jgi:osmotically-inducible protein OsmY
MKRLFTVFSLTLAISVFAFAQGGDTMKSGGKSTAKKPAAVMPKGDADIQKCITDKLAGAEKLKSQGFSATVSGGEATLTGTANNAGSKGAATKIAKSCGATKVTNNISSPPVRKPAEKKP